MRPQDDDFEAGRSYGTQEILEKLRNWATSTNQSRVIEIISNAIYQVGKKMKKTKKVRTHTIDGTYVLSKNKKLKATRPEFVVLDVTIKDLERLYLYAKQRGQLLKKKYDLGKYVVRLSTDVTLLVDNRRKK